MSLILNKLNKIFLLGLVILAVYITPSFLLHDANGYGNGMCLATCQAKLQAQAEAKLNENKTSTGNQINSTATDLESAKEFINQAKTINKNKATYISVILSKVCKHSPKCPTMKYLADTYDNSNKYLSGDFVFDNKTDEWKRTSPKYSNVFDLYKQSNNYLMIFIDPDDYTRLRTKTIIIEPELNEYFNRGQGDLKVKFDENTKSYQRIIREDFQISSCSIARMGWAGNGEKLFSNIIGHLYSGCTKDIGQNNTKIIQTKKTEFTDCGPQCQYQNWLKNATETAKKGFLINPNKTLVTNEVREQ